MQREELIEEAAKAIEGATYQGSWGECVRAAAAALAVFEKAHAPTACSECRRTDGQHKLDCGHRSAPTDDERASEQREAYRREHRAELMRQERAALRAAGGVR